MKILWWWWGFLGLEGLRCRLVCLMFWLCEGREVIVEKVIGASGLGKSVHVGRCKVCVNWPSQICAAARMTLCAAEEDPR